MNGQMRTYNLHSKEYQELPDPISLKDVGIKIDYLGLTRFANAIGKKLSELTKEEKEKFIISK